MASPDVVVITARKSSDPAGKLVPAVTAAMTQVMEILFTDRACRLE
jgi:signal recognition particle GTPase